MIRPAPGMPAPPSTEEELGFRLCGTAERRKGDHAAVEHLARSADPDRLLEFFRRERILALAGTRLDAQLPGAMPGGFRRAVVAEIAHNRHRGTLCAHLGQQLCDRLAGDGIEALVLKGAVLAERAHGDIGLRAAQSDIDLLVAPEQLQLSVKALGADGYEIHDNTEWAHGLPHYHACLQRREPFEVKVEVHWRLHWYERRFAQEMLARSVADRSGGPRLQLADELASLLLIFARDGYLGLRIPADIGAWWDAQGQGLPPTPLDAVVERHPRLRNPLLAAVDVLEREIGLPGRQLVSPSISRPRRIRTASRLVNWTMQGGTEEIATSIMLNDLLLTPPGAFWVFLRHYFFQPLEHYARVYGWPPRQRLRNRARRAVRAVGRIGRTGVKFARRLWQIRGGRSLEALPEAPGPTILPSGREPRVLIVSPVRNEGLHIERVVRSVAAQTRPPDLWLVADDGSDDDTLETLRALEPKVPFLRVLELQAASLDGKDRLAQALEAKAFNRALSHTDPSGYTHIGKLDGDIELPPDYFERILERMSRNPRLGIAGGSIIEPTGESGDWKQVTAPTYHVHGALKLFTGDCFKAVGGIQERLGWDTIDETYARMFGFETFRDQQILARHHRPSASADGKLRGRMRHGQCAYIARYSFPWVLVRSLKVAVEWDPRGISGVAFLWGYLSCAIRRSDRVEDDSFRRFVRAEHWDRIRHALVPGRRRAA